MKIKIKYREIWDAIKVLFRLISVEKRIYINFSTPYEKGHFKRKKSVWHWINESDTLYLTDSSWNLVYNKITWKRYTSAHRFLVIHATTKKFNVVIFQMCSQKRIKWNNRGRKLKLGVDMHGKDILAKKKTAYLMYEARYIFCFFFWILNDKSVAL